MALPEPGKYIAKLCDAPVIHDRENDDPPATGVQVFLPCEVIEGGARIVAIRTLISKEGVIQLNEWSRLQEIFGTYTMPIEMFAEGEPFFEKQFEIDVQDEEYNGKVNRKVKWINAVGGSGMKIPKSVESKSFLAKYGSKFRALAGAPSKPSAPIIPPKRPAPPAPPTGPTSTMEEAWNTLLETHAGIAESDAVQLWQTTIESMFPGKTNTDLTPHNWGALKEKFSDYVPM